MANLLRNPRMLTKIALFISRPYPRSAHNQSMLLDVTLSVPFMVSLAN
jgi:hypothetical protein